MGSKLRDLDYPFYVRLLADRSVNPDWGYVSGVMNAGREYRHLGQANHLYADTHVQAH